MDCLTFILTQKLGGLPGFYFDFTAIFGGMPDFYFDPDSVKLISMNKSLILPWDSEYASWASQFRQIFPKKKLIFL